MEPDSFSGIDRSVVPESLSTMGRSARPLNVELIRAGLAQMLSRLPPPPQPPHLTNPAFELLMERHASEVRNRLSHGHRGHDLARQLALTTAMSYETAAAFVGFLASNRARPSLSDILREIAEERTIKRGATGKVDPRRRQSRTAPPVPPWARQRRRR